MANCVSKDGCLQLAEIVLSETKYLGIWCRDRVTGYLGGGGRWGAGWVLFFHDKDYKCIIYYSNLKFMQQGRVTHMTKTDTTQVLI